MKKVVYALFLFCSYWSFSQNSDIGLQLSSDQSQRLALEYRTGFSEKWQFGIGATYGSEYNRNLYDRLLSASDTLVVRRTFSNRSWHSGLRLGFERRINESVFSLKGSLQISYENQVRSYADEEHWLDTASGQWRFYYGAVNLPPTASYPQTTYHWITPAATISAEMNLPLGEKFLVNAWVGSRFSSPIFISESNKVDPEGVFGEPHKFFVLNYNIPAGVGLRYLL